MSLPSSAAYCAASYQRSESTRRFRFGVPRVFGTPQSVHAVILAG